jgi:hypothetical protein
MTEQAGVGNPPINTPVNCSVGAVAPTPRIVETTEETNTLIKEPSKESQSSPSNDGSHQMRVEAKDQDPVRTPADKVEGNQNRSDSTNNEGNPLRPKQTLPEKQQQSLAQLQRL